MRFSSITGVVSTEETSRFERMIFRATRGNCFLHFHQLKDMYDIASYIGEEVEMKGEPMS